ncbi:MAG: hypothetical protein ACOX7H_05440 [Bacillota bacterium]|jgi:hypothetical protein
MLHVLISLGVGVAIFILLFRIFVMMGQEEAQLQAEAAVPRVRAPYAADDFSDEVLTDILRQAKTEEERQQIIRFAQENMLQAAAVDFSDAAPSYAETAVADEIDEENMSLGCNINPEYDKSAYNQQATDSILYDYYVLEKELSEQEGPEAFGYTPELEDSQEIEEYLFVNSPNQDDLDQDDEFSARESFPKQDLRNKQEQSEIEQDDPTMIKSQHHQDQEIASQTYGAESYEEKIARLDRLFKEQMEVIEKSRQEIRDLVEKKLLTENT